MSDVAAKNNLELFLTRDQIHARVQELGAQISRDFAGRPLVLVGVLKGAAIFVADLARAIALDCTFDFISIESYGAGTHSSGAVRVTKELSHSIDKRHVILVEDILDTGITLCYLKNLLLSREAAQLKIVTLLDKPSRRMQKIAADYVGFTVPNRFVVGYGMDCAERYRNLPDIYLLPADIQE